MARLIKIFTIFLALTILLTLAGRASGTASLEVTCDAGPVVTSLIDQLTQERWAGWIAQLSGAAPIRLAGQSLTIPTRYTPSMFASFEPLHSQAFEFVLQQLHQGYPDSQITIQDFPITMNGLPYTAKNLILELPGTTEPDEIVILSAHLDSISNQATTLAPGAEDNASGSAALLEAARLLSRYRFERTLQLIWFTGEEQGLVGSAYFTSHLPAGRTIVGDINLDMFGYDADNDHCFELHVGLSGASNIIGSCIQATIQANALNLTYDYLTSQASYGSDHASFWAANLGAVEVLENHVDQGQAGGCQGADPNPYYHQTGDTIDHLNLPVGTVIARAALASAANLAKPVGTCFDGNVPLANAARSPGEVALSWSAVNGTSFYRVWRSEQGCSAGWSPVAIVAGSHAWTDTQATPASVYQVEAVAGDGCVSLPSACVAPGFQRDYLPIARR